MNEIWLWPRLVAGLVVLFSGIYRASWANDTFAGMLIGFSACFFLSYIYLAVLRDSQRLVEFYLDSFDEEEEH